MPNNSIEIDLLHTLRKESGSDLKIDIWYEGEIWFFRPLGSIDSGTFSDMEITLMEAINQGMHMIVLDMTDVRYISSAGIRVLILGAKTLKKQSGELVLSSPNKTVDEIIGMSGLKKVFHVFPDNNSAWKYFSDKKQEKKR
ncbi:MAG: STAS domain-containing protein [Methanomicrobiales archaeon]|nr:STAS domain-containing protein [Methanomicrobiales archaeon]